MEQGGWAIKGMDPGWSEEMDDEGNLRDRIR